LFLVHLLLSTLLLKVLHPQTLLKFLLFVLLPLFLASQGIDFIEILLVPLFKIFLLLPLLPLQVLLIILLALSPLVLLVVLQLLLTDGILLQSNRSKYANTSDAPKASSLARHPASP
jgi:hypothetical protein